MPTMPRSPERAGGALSSEEDPLASMSSIGVSSSDEEDEEDGIAQNCGECFCAKCFWPGENAMFKFRAL